jgi:membrane protein implicated in regulation of membrane protease activity
MICYTREGLRSGDAGIRIRATRPRQKLQAEQGREAMKRILAVIQIIIIILIVGFGTWQLYLGNFELAFASFPFLVAYYVFVIANRRRP